MRMLRVAVISMMLLWPIFGVAFGAPLRDRVVVPITQHPLSNGATRYSVPVSVGGTHLQAELDTGATGLRFLADQVSAADVQLSSTPLSSRFGSGMGLTGTLGSAVVSIGSSAGLTMSVESVQTAACVDEAKECPEIGMTSEDPMFGLGANDGFKTILGTAIYPGQALDNPASVLADSWIVELPLPGNRDTGQLILNPSDDEKAGFRTIGLKNGMVVGGCVVASAPSRTYCGPTFIDSGSPGITVISNGSSDHWENGTDVQLMFAASAGEPITCNFKIDANFPGTWVQADPNPQLHLPSLTLIAGDEVYYLYDVLYDGVHRAIGLRPR